MPGYNGSGTYQRFRSWEADAAAGVKIRADYHDDEDDGFAAGLSNVICRDGQSTITQNIPFNAKKITNLGAPIDPTDAATKGYVDGIRNFSSAISITGSTPESVLKFTGATGPWGDSYVTAGLAYGVRGTTWVWNDKADFSGTDIMTLIPSGTNALVLGSIDTGQASGPWLYIDRLSPTPAVSDIIGAIGLRGKNSAALTKEYAGIYAQIADAASGSEDGLLILRITAAGALTPRLTCHTSGVDVIGDLVVSANLDVNGSTVTCTNLYAGETSYGISGVANVAIQAAAGISVEGPTVPIYAGKIGGNGTLMSIFQGTTVCGSISVANATTTSYNTASDIRIKTGVKGAENARALVDAVQVIEYQPVTKMGELQEVDGVAPGPEVWMGFSAQQAYGVFPTAVAPPDPNILDYNPDAQFGEEGFVPWMLDYSKFVPMLMANVQELNARNDALEARLAQLEAA